MNRNLSPVYFFSDAHLIPSRRADHTHRADRLERFLCHIRDNGADRVFILGDLFDFWFEYRHAVPAGQLKILCRLLEICEAGIPIEFIAGNHDFWCGDYLRSEIGMVMHTGPISVELQGRRIWMAHGDGLIRGNWGYRILRMILRNRLCISAYRILHPDLGIPLALASSVTSRGYNEARPLELQRFLDEVARPRFADGHDAVLLGHIHRAEHIREDDKDFLFLGDWIQHFTYATLSGGVFTQHTWSDD